MLKLYFTPGVSSMAPHIVLEESGEEYQVEEIDLERPRPESYLKINYQGKVPTLILDDGEPLVENTAILPYLGKRFNLWPADRLAEARLLSIVGFLATQVHPSASHMWHPDRFSADPSAFRSIEVRARESFDGFLKQIDSRLAGRKLFLDQYSVADPYLLTFYAWGVRREYPMRELKNFTALKDGLLERPAVQRVLAKEKINYL
jgi:glutathione S-transferase